MEEAGHTLPIEVAEPKAGGTEVTQALPEIQLQRRRIKTDKRDLPVSTLRGWVEETMLNLQPDFQRNWVWNEVKASRLIESLLLDMPIPVIYLAEEAEGTFSVVDGQQRLRSIVGFLNNQYPADGDFRLKGLQVLRGYNGMTFQELPARVRNMIRTSSLNVMVVQQESDPTIKYEVFARLNQGSASLRPQELRNCIYRGPYNDLLKELAKNAHLLKAMGRAKPQERMQHEELILRFFALWHHTHLKYHPPMSRFLNQEMEAFRHADPGELAKLRSLFERTIEMAYIILGENTCRRFIVGNEVKRDGRWEKFNVAIWDTMMYSLSFYQKAQIIPIADRIREDFMDLMTRDTQFIDFVTRGADTTRAMRYRVDTWRQRLQTLMDPADQGPRCFKRSQKERLFKANSACALCGQHIHDLDDAEVDHIEHYWRGGKTIPNNARLTHRFCNRSRGRRP